MEPALMMCVTNRMYYQYSRISSALIPLVISEVSNRELQWI